MKRIIHLTMAAIGLAAFNVSAATRYVRQGSPSPGPPYDAWTNAAHDIQTAVDAAGAGDEIVDATMLVVGGIIGAGIFINPAIVAARLESAGAVLSAWVAGGAVALAGAFAYGELGALFPRAGGQYVYLNEAYHRAVGFLYAWALLFIIASGAIAAVAIVFAQYTVRVTGGGQLAVIPLALAAIATLSALNAIGVKPGSRVVNASSVLKVAAILVLVAIAMAERGGARATASASRPRDSIRSMQKTSADSLTSFRGTAWALSS